jgi:ATP-dependent Clp protease ATP-binding subunit ClpA
LGFQASVAVVDERSNEKMGRSALEAARRKFTPEFMNRLDKIVIFHPLGKSELCRIVDLEIEAVRDRISKRAPGRSFEFTLTPAGQEFLIQEGTDARYGARHLKRTIERLLVQPLASLIASGQVRGGDVLSIDHEANAPGMTFVRVGERVMYGAEAA